MHSVQTDATQVDLQMLYYCESVQQIVYIQFSQKFRGHLQTEFNMLYIDIKFRSLTPSS